MASLTPRGKSLRWLSSHRGITEQPAGSNTDTRVDGIRTAQRKLGDWLVKRNIIGLSGVVAFYATGQSKTNTGSQRAVH